MRRLLRSVHGCGRGVGSPAGSACGGAACRRNWGAHAPAEAVQTANLGNLRSARARRWHYKRCLVACDWRALMGLELKGKRDAEGAYIATVGKATASLVSEDISAANDGVAARLARKDSRRPFLWNAEPSVAFLAAEAVRPSADRRQRASFGLARGRLTSLRISGAAPISPH
jgi:hypothetical protein